MKMLAQETIYHVSSKVTFFMPRPQLQSMKALETRKRICGLSTPFLMPPVLFFAQVIIL